MPPRRGYTENDIARMQQDAISRAQEMQSRARQTADDANQSVPPASPINNHHRGWSTNPGVQRRRPHNRHAAQRVEVPEPPPVAQPEPIPEPEPEPIPPPEKGDIPEPEQAQEPPSQQSSQPQQGKTTIIEDVLGAVGLDDDRLLIIGLLFILINAKADTTVILALLYLLL